MEPCALSVTKVQCAGGQMSIQRGPLNRILGEVLMGWLTVSQAGPSHTHVRQWPWDPTREM